MERRDFGVKLACLELQNVFDLLFLTLTLGSDTSYQVVKIKLNDISEVYFVSGNYYRSVSTYFLSNAWFMFLYF